MENVREIYWGRKGNITDWLWFTIKCEKNNVFQRLIGFITQKDPKFLIVGKTLHSIENTDKYCSNRPKE